jgi:superfamily II DNA or RNA helicase
MDKLRIEKGTTRAILHLGVSHPYAPYVREVTKDILTDYEWDNVERRKLELKSFSYFDRDLKRLHVPINALDFITQALDDIQASYEVIDDPPYEARDVDVKMVQGFEPRPDQVGVIDYIASDDPPRKGVATATGSGKTVTTIAGFVKYGKAGVVIVSGLQDQWIRRFHEFTDIGDRLYLVQGYQSLIQLMESEFKPDVIVFSLETLRLYVNKATNYENLPTFHQFLKYFGIGFKVMDEVHLNFHAQTIMDMHANVANNIYLTATFNASNRYTKKVLDLVYPRDMRYGEHDFNRYIDVVCYTFVGEVPEKACMRRRGYMHAKYESYLLKRKYAMNRYLDERLYRIIQEQYILKRKPKDKLLIYVARIDMAKHVHKWLKSKYPKFKIQLYIEDIKDTVLETADILVTTPKKGGTGTDIKNLLVVINTVSFQTAVSTEQLRGRLRELPDKRTPVYCEFVDVNIPAQDRHRMTRAYVHRRSAKSYTLINM